MSKVAVLAEHAGGAVRRPTLEALTLARSLGEPVAVWLGEGPSTDDIAALAAHGAVEVRVAQVSDQDAALPAKAAAAIEAAVGDAATLVVISTPENKERVALVARSTGAGIVVDASGAELVDGNIETTQSVFASTWNVRTRITADQAIVGIRPNSIQAVEADAPATGTVVPVEVALPDTRETLIGREVVEVEGIPLAEAATVVSGGRGTEGDFTLVNEFAAVLGAAVGATRDATEEGWISHEHMVGQTGITVTPALYVACGLSGAVHHRGGMQGSGTIVAVNTDPDAPIFEIADFGIVGDLKAVLPQAIEAIRKVKGTA